MELTKEKLIENGFTSNHPDRTLCNLYLSSKNPEYRIDIEQTFKPSSNQLCFNVNCWLSNGLVIIKRASLSDVTTIEELQSILNLCGIELKLK